MSNAFLRLGVAFSLIGMAMGYVMGATQDFAASPVHAHVNLLGWASMFLYGLFYRAFPDAGVGRLAQAHLWLAVVGLVIFMPALAIELLVRDPGLAQVGAIGLIVGPTLVMLGAIIFAVIVFRATGRGAKIVAG